jgi:hypothetical protein
MRNPKNENRYLQADTFKYINQENLNSLEKL